MFAPVKYKLWWNYHVDSLGRKGREMVSVISISAPFLPISYLCAIFSFLVTDSFDLGYFIVTAQWKLMTIGTYYNLRERTFDNGPDGLSITPCLQVEPSYPKLDENTYFKFHVQT